MAESPSVHKDRVLACSVYCNGSKLPEAHLTQQGDVLLVVVVKIGRLVVGVKDAILQDVLCALGQHTAHHRDLALGAVRHLIVGHAKAGLVGPQQIVCFRGRLAVLIPGTFDAVRH